MYPHNSYARRTRTSTFSPTAFYGLGGRPGYRVPRSVQHCVCHHRSQKGGLRRLVRAYTRSLLIAYAGAVSDCNAMPAAWFLMFSRPAPTQHRPRLRVRLLVYVEPAARDESNLTLTLP